MRTDSHRLAGILLALGFLAGWGSAAWVSPPTAVTQTRPARPVAPPPDVPMPHIALDAVTAPDTVPSAARNPFVFTDRAAPSGRLAARAALDAPPETAAEAADPAGSGPEAEAPAPLWRVVGIAAEADGRITAIVSGGGDIFLLVLGDRLPDGSAVTEIDAAGLVVTTPAGERVTLRLP